MRIIPFLAVLGVAALIAPAAFAQIAIPAPAGWSDYPKSGGAHSFTPPDLQAGEVYPTTVYDSAPLNGATLAEYVTAFAGPVGKAPGHLAVPLKIQTTQGQIVSGTGVYNGPNGTALGVMFLGVSLDGGANIHMMRTLFSGQGGLMERYAVPQKTLMGEMVARAKAEAGDNLHTTQPVVLQKLKTVGGELVPGVYAGNQYRDNELFNRFRIYIYADGQYRMCDQNDEDIKERFFDEHVGNVKYNRNSGALSIDWTWGLGFYGDDGFCYYGKDANGKPAIYAQDTTGFTSKRTLLTWDAPPTKRLSKTQMEEAKAAAEAEKNRFKWVTAPGRGVQNAQIAAVLLDSNIVGETADENVYLLLRDGTVYAGLPVPPDELDVIKSRQREPDKWGKWRPTRTGYSVSWNGAPFQNMAGFKVEPAPAQSHLGGHFGTGRSSPGIMNSSWELWGVTFTKGGRFRKDHSGGASSNIGFGDTATHANTVYDDEGSFSGASGENFVVGSETKKKNPHGDREGDYSLNGYVLTLRYDNGKVARLPFFFLDAAHKGLWFEGASMSLDTK